MKTKEKTSKKTMSTCVNFSNMWPGLLDQEHQIWKNYIAQFSTNQILKDKIRKRILLYKRILNKNKNKNKNKITIERMRIKNKIKNKLDENYIFFLIEGWKIILTK